jgi:hypothetical protein
MNDECKPLGTIRSKRSKKAYRFFWNPANHHVYIERPSFFGSSKERTGHVASSWEMAYHAAEAYAYDR